MTELPGSPALRRRAALTLLVLGGLFAYRALDRDVPHEHTLIFRLADELRGRPLRLRATLTRAGESEARGGFTLERSGEEVGDPKTTFRAPNGTYMLSVDCDVAAPGKGTSEPAEKRETSSVHRVTLEGSDIVVPIGQRVPE
jgi:hypothetical protein